MKITIESPDGLVKHSKIYLEDGTEIAGYISGLHVHGSVRDGYHSATLEIPLIKIKQLVAELHRLEPSAVYKRSKSLRYRIANALFNIGLYLAYNQNLNRRHSSIQKYIKRSRPPSEVKRLIGFYLGKQQFAPRWLPEFCKPVYKGNFVFTWFGIKFYTPYAIGGDTLFMAWRHRNDKR